MEDAKFVDVPPDVSRISEGLRDTGYEFNTSVADIIDNSISAGASVVDVRMGVDFNGIVLVSVADNGCGMDRDGLVNAMKYGSKKREDPSSLGKFGLGLKTASTAFCRRLLLISRPNGTEKPLRAIWDLDEMEKSNQWKLELSSATTHEVQLLDAVAKGKSGTVVIWEKVDRLLTDYKEKNAQPFKKALKRTEDSLRDHIALVYQRFLDPDDSRARTLEIKFNGTVVNSWDPFCINEVEKPVSENEMKVVLPSGVETKFKIRAFILPRPEEFTTSTNKIAAKISNERQGVYVYRENRLIHGPDWLGMFKQEPHYSLLRVELSFDHKLDDAFQVDIKKSRITLGDDLFDWLRDKFLGPVRREAETQYRRGKIGVIKGAAALLHTASNNAIEQKSGVLKVATFAGVNKETGEVTLKNNLGDSTTKIRILTTEDGKEARITTSETLENGVLWEAVLIEGKPAVTLNTGHSFYTKAYLPNKNNSTVIQALDFMLWALAQAEVNNLNNESKEVFEEFRIEVSRNLKKLVADLPDPPELLAE